MANISYDRQSFSIDHRRVWLVSGAMHFQRTPRGLWRKRIRAAKQAGLNCIETCVFWNAHETAPGEFDFTGERDLRTFIKTVGEEGLFCIVRPGPYMCGEWDFGGLPARLNDIEGIKLRQANGPYLEACAQYIREVMLQIKDLQVTSRRSADTDFSHLTGRTDHSGYRGEGGGPVIMMQAENEWFCSNPQQHDTYLLESVRHLRENGCTVPITNCNNLWQQVDGTLDTWNGRRHLTADMRQLAEVNPKTPRFVAEFWPGWFDCWDTAHHSDDAPGDVLHRIAGILATGSMFNLYLFHGGTNFGFFAGRSVLTRDSYVTTSYDYGAPLTEAGGRGATYHPVRRIATFASRFDQLFANLDHAPHAAAAPEGDHPPAVIHATGSRGDVIFILKNGKDKTRELPLLLPDGRTLPVPLGDDRAAWVVLNAKLGDGLTLDYTNLRPFALLGGKMLILFGPAGAEGLASINEAPLSLDVPKGKQPTVVQVDDLTLVVLNEQQVDASCLMDDGLVVGAAEFDETDQPVPLTGWSTRFHIDLDGKLTRHKQSTPRKPTAPTITGWRFAPLDALIDGSDPGYEPIDGPASLETLGQDFGYGWYRVPVNKTKVGKLLWPEADDRLHVYQDGKLLGILGHGPDAKYDPVALKLDGTVTVLADNLGRNSFGQDIGDRKGVFGPLYKVTAAKLAKPKVTNQPAPDPFELTGFVYGRHLGDRRPAQALSWNVSPVGRKPMVLEINDLPMDCVVMVNDEPVDLYSAKFGNRFKRFVLTPGNGPVKGGKNKLTLALYEPLPAGVDPVKHLRFYKVNDIVSNPRGQWSFSKWTPPEDVAFSELPKTSPARPAWFHATFNVKQADVPLWLKPVGMSKGQLYLNGHNLGRFWVATAAGKKVPPQDAYYLPEPWLHTDKPNDLLIFDEHGRLPSKCKLVYNWNGPYG